MIKSGRPVYIRYHHDVQVSTIYGSRNLFVETLITRRGDKEMLRNMGQSVETTIIIYLVDC